MRLVRAHAMAAAVALSWALPAAASDPALAREQLKIGYSLAHEGKCDQALEHLHESLRLDPKAITLINLADCEEKVGRLTDAMVHWVDARARAQAEGARPIEEEAEKRALALEPRLARLTIVLAPGTPADAVVERDGIALVRPSLGIPLPLDPGAHVIVLRAAGRLDKTTRVTLGEGEGRRIEVESGAVAVPSPSGDARSSRSAVRPLMLVGLGAAALGVTVGTVAGLMALDAAKSAESACPTMRCDQKALDDIDSGRAMGTTSTIGFAVAGAGAALAVYGLLSGERPGRAKKPDASVGVSVGPSFTGVSGRF
jgi:tetratricopeptide (TPR) repeat protein